eukprot:3420798-Pyramimonas_sp.AAC.1
MKKGRQLLKNLGWIQGGTIGLRQRAEGLPPQEPPEASHWTFEHLEKAGAGAPKFAEQEFECPKKLRQLLVHFRQCQAM